MGFKLSVFLKVSTVMHDTERESGIQNSEQLKLQSFAHNSTKFNLKKEAAKRHVKQKDMAYFLPFGTELLFPLFKEENFLNYLFVRHLRSSIKRGCISNSDCVCPTFKFSSNPIIEFHFFTCIGNFKLTSPEPS